MKKQTDDLVKRAKRHESEAFTELMQLYMTDMYKVAYAILMNDEDAADAIGDTILICWEKMNQLVKIQYFKTWMTRILINKCYDIRKKNQNLICLDEYEEPAAYQKLVDGVVITCIANYKDGTKKGVKINVGAAALTYEEIGMNVDGMTLQIEGKETVQLQPTDKVAVFTFELQP